MTVRKGVRAPDWSDFSAGDPAIALLELFAFLGERLDEEHRRHRRRRRLLALTALVAAAAALVAWHSPDEDD